MRGAPGPFTRQVLALLAEHGPMTRMELCEQMGKGPNYVSGIVSRLVATERVHIARWARERLDGHALYARAVYALGPGDGEPPPKPRPLTEAQISKRVRKLAANRVTSVFELGMSVKKRYAARRIALRDAA